MHPLRAPLLAALLLLVAGAAGAADSPPEILSLATGATRAAADLRVLERTGDGLVLSLELTGIERKAMNLAGRDFDQLAIPGGGFRGAEGEAALPTVTRLVAVPDGVGVTVTVTERSVRSLGALTPAPVLPVSEAGKAIAGLDPTAYDRTPRREPTVSVGDPVRLHGVRVVPVTFAPVGYDPAAGEVTAASRLTAALAFAGRDQRAAATGAPRPIPESFATLYEQTIIGWDRATANVHAGPGSVIYVCPDISTVVDGIADLVEWRRQQGHHVEVVTTATTGPTATNIRAWLMNRYATLDPPLEYVVLVGDANGAIAMPTFHETSSGYYGEGDHDYSRLDGEDVLPDVHVGRLSVQTPAQLTTAVNKIVGYETAPDFTDTDWFTTAGLTGDPSTSGYSCIFTNQFVKQELQRLGYTRIDTIWSGNFTSLMLATINQGETVFTYRGLANMSGLSANHILYTTNGGQLPFACILTCDTGSFHDDLTARSEAWLRAANGGGIAAVGTATLGTHTRYNNCMFLGIMDHLLDSGDFRFGPAITRGKLNFYVNFWENEPNQVWAWLTWNNLMGDPVTELWTGVPQALAVEHPAALAPTAGALPVTVHAGGARLAGARVAVYQAGTVRDWALTDSDGHAVLDIAGATSGDLHVTVTGHDLYPYRGNIAVGTVARSLDLVAQVVDDAAGNGDGEANPGESLAVSAALINGGTTAASGVTAALVDGPAWASFGSGTVGFGTVAAGATIWGTEPWTINLSPAAPGGEEAVFELEATSAAETWTSRLVVPVVGPRGSYYLAIWALPGGSPDPGESGDLSVVLTNTGNLATAGVTGTLRCDNRWCDVTDATGTWGAVDPGANIAQADPFAITLDPECYRGHPVRFVLELAFAEGGTQELEFTATVGAAGAGDPTGPDAYGYYAFSNDDTHEFAPPYDWTDLVGLGTDIGISDDDRWDDETRIVNLPFTFVYYGEAYDQVSICSNGWLAFGRSGLHFYRNWKLPADGSPDAMVCAFWDDLAEGRVYTWHDTANHRFIVQWENMRTWYSINPPYGYYSGNCTFQIILTEPAYSGVETGDGLITMQYQSVTLSHDETTRFTTGIQDHTRTVGLTYAYGNRYADGAATVNGGRAIAFRPIVAEDPDITDAVPTTALALAQNHPNPFNPQTVIRFDLPAAQAATLRVYDVQGRCVRTLAQGECAAGRHEIVWKGRNDAGRAVPSGTYFYRLVTDDGSLVRKMSLLK